MKDKWIICILIVIVIGYFAIFTPLTKNAKWRDEPTIVGKYELENCGSYYKMIER